MCKFLLVSNNSRINPRACRGVERNPHVFFVNNSRKKRRVATNFPYPLFNQFDTCPENVNLLRCQLTKLWRHMSGHVRAKSADFAINRIWASFVAFWSVHLHSRQHHCCSWISRSHTQLPRGQGHARSQVSWFVSAAHFSRYNYKFTAILSLGGIG